MSNIMNPLNYYVSGLSEMDIAEIFDNCVKNNDYSIGKTSYDNYNVSRLAYNKYRMSFDLYQYHRTFSKDINTIFNLEISNSLEKICNNIFNDLILTRVNILVMCHSGGQCYNGKKTGEIANGRPAFLTIFETSLI